MAQSNKKKEILRAIKYFFIACSAGLIQMGSFALLNELTPLKDDLEWISYGISLALSVIWNFTFNRKLTFKSANNIPIAMLKVIGYYCVFTPFSLWFVDYLTNTLMWKGFLGYVAVFLNMFINLVTEFLFMRFFVFGKSIDTAVKKDETPEETPDGQAE